MIRNKTIMKGKVTATVFDGNGNVKKFPQSWWRKLLGIPGRDMIMVNHNIVTDQGDALIADLMSTTPARTKVDNSNGYIAVGTGWTGSTPKANTAVNTPTGSREPMDSTYPKQKGTWGNANDNVTQYRSTFEAGDLNATSPAIDEVAIMNASTSGDCLAYAQITPELPVSSSDTLQIDWEITFLGA